MRILAVTNMYPTRTHPSQGTFIERQVESLRSFVDVEVLHIGRVEAGRGAYTKLPGRLRRSIARSRPDVVHVMNGGVLALSAGVCAGRLPFVVSFCGSDLLGDPQVSWRARAAGRLTVWASKMAALRADAIITKSPQLATKVPALVAAGKIHVIPNGVDLDRFRPLDSAVCRQQLGWPENEFHVLFAGSPVSRTKNYAAAQAAVERLRARGVPARLQLMQNIAHEQVPSWLNAAHVLLLCSLHEGSPNIVKESLACECPVVSTDVGDVRERLSGIEGCYLSDSDPESLANCLNRVFERPARLTCRHAVAALALQSISKRIVSVYRRLCESDQPSPACVRS